MSEAPLTVLYAGPSLNAAALTAAQQQAGLAMRPPIRRGDLPELLRRGFNGTIIIADGVFHSELAVGHIEIRDALEAGNTVYGLSSMGAIRAYEMGHLGMKGYGRVYQYFKAHEDFQDDEVALLHDNVPPYKPNSEPLVHIRVCIEHLTSQGTITEAQAQQMVAHMKQLWFGDRTLKLLSKLLQQHTTANATQVLAGFEQYRIKQHDLEAMVAGRLWQTEHNSHDS